MLQNDVFSLIGQQQINTISVSNVIEVLTKISERGSTYQAHRCRGILQQIFNYARALELCETNPAEAIRHVPAIKTHQHNNYRALEFNEMSGLLGKLRSADQSKILQSRLALELLILTAVRPGNVRFALWNQFHGLGSKNPVWLIPAEVMKKRRDHAVPLSKQTVGLLEKIKDQEWHQEFLFPGVKKVGLSNGTFKRQLKILGYGPESVHPHGFRSTFSTFANESGKWSPDAIEWVLAHVKKNEIRGAYNRSQYLEERRKLLQWWADELDKAA